MSLSEHFGRGLPQVSLLRLLYGRGRGNLEDTFPHSASLLRTFPLLALSLILLLTSGSAKRLEPFVQVSSNSEKVSTLVLTHLTGVTFHRGMEREGVVVFSTFSLLLTLWL